MAIYMHQKLKMFKNQIFTKNILNKKLIIKTAEKFKLNSSLIKIHKKNFNGLFERPTQSLITHLHVLGIIVNKIINI